MHQSETRKITEGAMMVGMIGLILFFNRQSAGIFESTFYWLLSLPILVYTARQGIRWGLITSVAMMLLSLMISTPQTIFYLFSSLVIGLMYGVGIRKKWSNRILLGTTMIFTFFSYLITTFVLASLFGYNIGEELQEIMIFLETLDVNLPIPAGRIAMMISIIMLAAMIIMQSLCVHLLAILILKRLKVKINSPKSYFDLRLPMPAAVLASIFMVLGLAMEYIQVNEEIATWLLALAGIAMIVYIAYGITVAMCFMHVLGKQKYMVLLVITVLIPLCYPFLVGLGLWDSFTDIKTKLKRGELNGPIRKF